MKQILYFDGGSRGNPGPAGAGVVLQDAHGNGVYEAGFFLGPMTNNMAEYSGLLKGLEQASRRGATEVDIYADSELVVRQLNGDYRVKNEKLLPLFEAAFSQLRRLERWTIRHVPRAQNHRADHLANAAMDAGEDIVELDLAARPATGKEARGPTRGAASPRSTSAADGPPVERADARRAPAKSPARGPAEKTASVVVRCVRPARGGSCPAPCRQSEELVFDETVPAGLCLGVAGAVLRAVETVRLSRKPARVYCPRDGCGACFSVKPG